MQKKYLLRIALAALLITGSVIILSSSKKAGKEENRKESTGECCKNKDESAPSEELIWESFSRQFISSIQISH